MPNYKRFPLEDLELAMEEQSGFCLGCGAEHCGIEPDARGYDCEDCGLAMVYGAEEIICMGLVEEE